LLPFLLLALAADIKPEDLYQQHCAACHANPGGTRAPALTVMRQMSPENILNSLENGLMKQQASGLAVAQRKAIAEWVAGRVTGAGSPNAGNCEGSAKRPFDKKAGSWAGWGNGITNPRFVNDPIRPEKLVLKWAFGIPGAAVSYAQPAISEGRIYVGSAARKVYALDARTGCIYWTFTPEANVRASVTVTPERIALFADQRSTVYAVQAATGELLWKTKVDKHPYAHVTGAPTYHNGRLYVPVSSGEDGSSLNPKYQCCTGRGGIVAVDAASGKILWHTYSVVEEPKPTKLNAAGTQLWGPSGASIWAAPTIDVKRNLLYTGTGDNHSTPATDTSDAILAMDLDTGKIAWTRQLTAGDQFNIACVARDQTNCPTPTGPDLDIGASPIIAGNTLLVGQKSAVVTALDLDRSGAVIWQARVGRGGPLGGIQWGIASDGKRVYAAVSDVTFQTGAVIGSGKPFEADPKTGGGLFALDIGSGRLLWSAAPPVCGSRPRCSPAQSAAITVTPNAVFSGSVDGRIRAYAPKDGRVLWEFDTIRHFSTVNGVEAKGGSMDGPGPVVVDGMLYVPSGYGNWGGNPGNVLLAFGAEK
jgi:polyvinyl alcohol dehydrogenase (cytochrome)